MVYFDQVAFVISALNLFLLPIFLWHIVSNVDKVFLLNQINQLEKDKDVVAQAQAIVTLEALPQLSFSVVNALNNFLIDPKVVIASRFGLEL